MRGNLQMTAEATISTRVLRTVFECAERLGVDRAEVERQIGLDDTDLSDPDGRAPLQAAVRLDALLRKLLGPSAAVRLGEVHATAHATVLAYLLENCQNLGEAYQTIHRYRAIVMELTAPELEVSGQEAHFGCVYPPQIVANLPGTAELRLTYWLAKGRKLTGTDWVPKEIHLQSEQSDPAIYELVFRCPVLNSAPRTQIVFEANLLDLPVLSADTNLRYFLQPIADEILTRLPERQSFSQEVQSCISAVLKDGGSYLELVADQLHVSTRTLQRRLEKEETSFGVLLDEARRVAAFEYLKDKRVSISDTAFLLGFSEPSTFYRAFKRWAGTTPADYRRTANA